MTIALNFDANTVAPRAALEAMPAGWYNMQITGSEMKPTKDNTGQYLELEMTILDGPYAGRKAYDRLNLVNSNPTAVEIAYGTLSAICHATGVIRAQTAEMLHGIPMQVKLKLRAAKGDYEASNDVSGYDNIRAGHATVTAVAGPVVGGVAGAPAGVPAWAQGAAPQPQAAPAQPQGAPVATWQPPANGQQPWAQPGAVPGVPPQAAPAPAFQPPAPPAPVVAQHVMTAKAAGATYAQFVEQGWTDEMMVQQGFMEPPAPVAPQPPQYQQPAQMGAPQPPQAATGAAGPTPPWAR
jgi:hypothetical protein